MTQQFYDLVLYNGDIITLDPYKPSVEMIGICTGKFVHIGEYKEEIIKNSIISVDLKGKALLPGFIDLHTHLWAEASVFSIDLGLAKSFIETIEILKEKRKLKAPFEWIFASNWDESKWNDNQIFLNRNILDEVSRENPIYARREDGHLVSVNSPALEILNIPKDHPGLEKDSDGVPTGILKDVWLDMSEYYKNEIPRNIIESIKIANSKGITTVVDNITITPGSYRNIIQAYQKLDKEGKLNIRVFINPPFALMNEFHRIGFKRNWGSDMLCISGFKAFVDGALGAETALLNSPYNGTNKKGELFIKPKEIIKQITMAENNDYTMCIHAIGDEAINLLLNCYEKGINAAGNTRSLQNHRIEHAEMITDEQVRKAEELGILLSMQPNFLKWEYPGGLYETRLGPQRFMTLNRFAKIQELGAKLFFGSDNMPLSPLFGIQQATGFPSDQIRISVLDAIKAYTINNSCALYMENKLGSISEGKFADFVVLSKSPLEVSNTQIKDELIEKTYVNGKLVFQSKL